MSTVLDPEAARVSPGNARPSFLWGEGRAASGEATCPSDKARRVLRGALAIQTPAGAGRRVRGALRPDVPRSSAVSTNQRRRQGPARAAASDGLTFLFVVPQRTSGINAFFLSALKRADAGFDVYK